MSHEVRRISREDMTDRSLDRRPQGRRATRSPWCSSCPASVQGRLTDPGPPPGKDGPRDRLGTTGRTGHGIACSRPRTSSGSILCSSASRSTPNPVAARPEPVITRHTTRSLAADQMQDLATVLAWAKSAARRPRSQPDRAGLTPATQLLVARPCSKAFRGLSSSWTGLPDTQARTHCRPRSTFPACFSSAA